MIRRILFIVLVVLFAASACTAWAAEAPAEIKIGTLYASSGTFAGISMPMFDGLKLWIDQKNAEGGVFVKPFNKKIPIKLVAYDDQSNTATAATLYNQLITQDKVNILTADAGSVLTSVAVPIAREHKMLLINQSGTGSAFFSRDNPYIVLVDSPASSIWPTIISGFLIKEGTKLGIRRVALIYSTNDFTGTQANTVRRRIKESHSAIKLVYDKGVPTSTSSYTVLINNIKAANPDAVIELGYPNNDISFLRNLQDSATRFKWLFTIYAGLEADLLEKNVGAKGLGYVFTYLPPSLINYKTEFGMSLSQFHAAWNKKYSGSKVEFGFNALQGYNTGLVLEKALAATRSLDQLALRKAIFSLSGKLKTLDDTFKLNEMGAQIGEITPLGQIVPNGKGGVKFVVIYPKHLATGKPVYPAP